MVTHESRTKFAVPEGWNRYYQANIDLDPLVGTPGLPQAGPGEGIRTAVGEFVQGDGNGFFIRPRARLTRDPAEISAGLSGAGRSGTAKSVLGTRRRRLRTTASGTHADFQQLIRGAPVIGADVRVHQDSQGVFAVSGRPIGDLGERDPGAAPPFEPSEALRTCAERFEIDRELRSATVRQVIFPETEGATWAYEVTFVVPDHAVDVCAFLRADGLTLMLSYNIASTATGRASVYPVNPMQTPDLVEARLEGLDDPGNLLRGAVLDVSQAAAARTDQGDGDFRVDPTDPSFDEAQAYHHLWRASEYFRSIADPGLMAAKPFTPMTAIVNDPKSPNNAYFAPTTGELRFGLFGDRSSARSASVVFHEFGHAVSDGTCQLGRSYTPDTQSRGLSEGFSDYFAASALNDPRLGDYVADDERGARNCADAQNFSTGFVGEEHATGAVWAAVLWGVRGLLGQATADQLAIESLNFLNSTSAFDDAREALHSADEQISNGANKSVIDEEYEARSPTG